MSEYVRPSQDTFAELILKNKCSVEIEGIAKYQILNKAVELVAKFHPDQITIESIVESMDRNDDEKTFALLKEADTQGVHSLSSDGIRELLRIIKPDCYEDMMALYVLYHPKPLHLGMADEFVSRKHNKSGNRYLLPQLEEILRQTYGVILYHQQISQIAIDIAGFSEQQASDFTAAMSENKESEIKSCKAPFLAGCQTHGLSAGQAETLYEKLEKYAGCYKSKGRADDCGAFYTYKVAYLKAHYSLELRAATLTACFGSSVKMENEIWTSCEIGISVLPPDINCSHAECVPEGDAARLGLASISGLSETCIQHILAMRKQDGFGSFEEFLLRIDLEIVQQNEIELLIKAGALKPVLDNPSAAVEGLDSAITELKQFSGLETKNVQAITLPAIKPWSCSERLAAEYKALGFYASGHPLEEYIPSYLENNLSNLKLEGSYNRHDLLVRVISICEFKELTVSKEIELAVVTVDDSHARYDMRIDPSYYPDLKSTFAINKLLLIQARSHNPSEFDLLPVNITDAYELTRKLPEIEPEYFHFGYVKYMAEKEFAESIIATTVQHINNGNDKLAKTPFDINTIPLDDPETYEFLHTGNTDGLFELDTSPCQQLLKEIRPENFEGLLIMVVLSTPFRFEHMSEEYIECAQGKKEPSFLIPELRPILESTYGIIIYQEQVRGIVEKLAGFSANESNSFRRALAVKRPAEVAEMRKRFKQGIGTLITGDEADSLFDWLEKFAGSAVKKEFLIEAVTISYRMAWLKVHYAEEFERAVELAG